MMTSQAMEAYGAPLKMRTTPVPAPRGREVLVRISHCGLCHSDLHLHEGRFDMGDGKHLDIRSGRPLPFILGHEICGTVDAVGDAVAETFGAGPYAVYPWCGCGTCARCRAGDEHLCDASQHLGINRDGGFATHVIVPDPRHLIDVARIPVELAGSLMCSGITAYGAFRKAEPALAGRPLMVVGLGGVGMMAVRIATALAGVPVFAADIDPAKRFAAAEAGAHHVFDPRAQGVRKTVLAAMDGPCGAAVDFVGSGESIDFAAAVTGKGSTIVVAGLMGGRMTMATPLFPLRSLTIAGTFVASPAQARELVAFVREGRVSLQPATVRPLSEVNEAMRALAQGEVVGRVVLRV